MMKELRFTTMRPYVCQNVAYKCARAKMCTFTESIVTD